MRQAFCSTVAMPRVSSGTCRGCEKVDGQIKTQGLDAKASYLDFFGVPVKAAETLTFINGMRLLARKVCLTPPSQRPYHFLHIARWCLDCMA